MLFNNVQRCTLLHFTLFSKETVADSDSEEEDQGVGMTFGGRTKHDLMMNDEKVRSISSNNDHMLSIRCGRFISSIDYYYKLSSCFVHCREGQKAASSNRPSLIPCFLARKSV